MLNVSVNTSDNSIITVSSPQNPTKANLTVNQDGTLSEEAKIENLNQQFEFLQIHLQRHILFLHSLLPTG